MSLYEKFELQRLVRDDGVKTFEGVEKSTGRPILAHLFVNPQAVTTRVMLDQINHLSAADQRRVIDRGQHEGSAYIITDRLADYPGLSEFLAAKTGRPALEKTPDKPAHASLNEAGAWKVVAPPPPPGAPQQPPASRSLDEQFANLFESSELPVAAPKAPPVVSPKPELKPPGEFTRMFQSTPRRPADIAPAAPAPTQQPPAPPPGAFTRMFQATPERPADAAPAGLPPARPQPPPPGEFTRMFQATPQRPAEATPAMPAPTPPQPPAQPPGEFTRMFQAPPQRPASATPPAPAPPQPPAQPPGEFTQMLRAATSTPPPSTPPAMSPAKQPGEFTQMLQAPAPRPAAEPAKAGPGEFTRFFQRPASDPLPATPAMQQPLAPQSSNPGERVGEFTRVFGTRDIPAPPPNAQPITPIPSAGLSSGATQTFATPSVPPPVPSAPAVSVTPRAPGEYTQMFSVAAPLTLGQAPSQSAPAAEVSRPANSRLPLLLGISAGVILILALVLYLLLRTH